MVVVIEAEELFQRLLLFSDCFFLFLGVLSTFKPRSCSKAISAISVEMLCPWSRKVMVHSAEYDLFMFWCVLCFHVFEDDDDDEDDDESGTEFCDGATAT